jgi:hypothetical protein
MTEQETTQGHDDKSCCSSACKFRGGKVCIPAIGAVVVGLASALIFSAISPLGLTRFMFAYITSFAFFLSIALGALFFICFQHVTRAAWSVTSRRMAEVLAMTMPVLAIAFLPIAGNVLMGSGTVYPWAMPHGHHAMEHAVPAGHEEATAEVAGEHVQAAPVEQESSEPAVDLAGHGRIPGVIDAHTEGIYTAKKAAYLYPPFFIVRWVIFFAVWIALSFAFWRKSVEQDTSGDPMITRYMERLAPLGIVLLAVTTTYGAFDLIMSLSPAWFSTIFGVYYFSGAMLAIFASLIVVLSVLRNKGLIDTHTVTKEHLHDLGKFMFGFVVFWAYIAFSQYMLIWYASLPETTFWFVARGATTVSADFNTWSFVSIALVFGHFFIPFVGLMSRHIKRTNTLLVFHWVDIWWLIEPEMSVNLTLGIVELGCLLGLGGLFVGTAVWVGSLNALTPQRDPRIAESLAFKNM